MRELWQHVTLVCASPPLQQTGKVHFGYIYGIGAMGCLGMYTVLNLMTGSVAGDNGERGGRRRDLACRGLSDGGAGSLPVWVPWRVPLIACTRDCVRVRPVQTTHTQGAGSTSCECSVSRATACCPSLQWR